MDPLDGLFLPLDATSVANFWSRVKADGFPVSPSGGAAWLRKTIESKGVKPAGVLPPLLTQGAAWAQRNPDKVRMGLEIASKLLRRTP